MKSWIKLIVLVLSFASLYGAVNIGAPAFLSDSAIVETQSPTLEQRLLVTLDKKSSYSLASEPDIKESSSDIFSLLPSRINATLFRDGNQNNPDYRLKVEFLLPDFSIQLFENLFSLPKISPWFIYFKNSSNNRLSGWKDGNSLYAANITYH
ncbi:hypothetical protein [Aliikangiella coralliicola]|uniref:Uncharacterized protein n=1 Tax=Aliikangiella coralliicola TaxID=2592383 RepID=A0A545U6F6_9GAMM|nr:hypothetical protein [Aliikangiella coralliicola]TQV85060.1 hypothetical protein FLL46_21980 [Aliikangiella coralliicola]